MPIGQTIAFCDLPDFVHPRRRQKPIVCITKLLILGIVVARGDFSAVFLSEPK
jgi:hypothetical protein